MYINSDNCWQRFLDITNNLQTPNVLYGFISNDCERYNHHAITVLQNIKFMKHKEGLRIWKNGVYAPAYSKTISENPPKYENRIEDWAYTVFDKEKFGMIINGCQRFSEGLNIDISTQLQPLFELIGIPLGGLDITFFLGNYGYTPLGFHLDPEGHKVIHFHIGPGKKSMYLISPELYESVITTYKNKEGNVVEELLRQSTKFTFNQGDLFFMPEGNYHIGYTYGFSLGITIWLKDIKYSELIKKMLGILAKDIACDSSAVFLSNTKTDNGIAYEEIRSSVNPNLRNLSLDYILSLTLEKYKKLLLSNSGFNLNELTYNEEIQIDIEDSVVGVYPFKVYYTHLNESTEIYVRKNSISCLFNPYLEYIIDTINSYMTIKVIDLIQPLLTDWDIDQALHLINKIYYYKGLKLIKDKFKQ